MEKMVYINNFFKDNLEKRHQTIYSGVGAHGKNGVAERVIQTIATSTRTMMIHHALTWLAHFDMLLWPFSLEYVAYIWNHLPDTYKIKSEWWSTSHIIIYVIQARHESLAE